MAAREVLILLYDGVQSLDVTGPLEVFTGGSRYQQARGHGPAYAVRTAAADGAPVTTSSGLTLVPAGPLPTSLAGVDTLVVPGGNQGAPAPRLAGWLRQHADGPRRVTSVCTGAFLLAEAGLLDGRRVTTHWEHCATLAGKYPGIRVDPDPIFVRDGNLATSAGVTAGIDLALALIEDDLGRDAALTVARELVVFLRRPGGQAQFSVQLQTQAASRRPLRDVQQWIAEHPEANLSVEELARRATLSPRQFARAFAAEVGVPPGRYVDQVRVEAARRRLEDTADGVEETARACGYRTPEAMRRAFIKDLGVSPAEYRRRFSRGAPARPRCH